MKRSPPNLNVEFHPNGYVMTLVDKNSGMRYVYILDKAFDVSTSRFVDKDSSQYKELSKPEKRYINNVVSITPKK